MKDDDDLEKESAHDKKITSDAEILARQSSRRKPVDWRCARFFLNLMMELLRLFPTKSLSRNLLAFFFLIKLVIASNDIVYAFAQFKVTDIGEDAQKSKREGENKN